MYPQLNDDDNRTIHPPRFTVKKFSNTRSTAYRKIIFAFSGSTEQIEIVRQLLLERNNVAARFNIKSHKPRRLYSTQPPVLITDRS